MSIEMMTRVWKYSQARSGHLLVLLAIADHADDEGVAYPSIPGIALKSRLKMRQVHNAINALVKYGELSVAYKEGPNGKNLYTVLTSKEKVQTLQNLHGATGCTVDPAMGCTVQPVAPKSSIRQVPNHQPLTVSTPPTPPVNGGSAPHGAQKKHPRPYRRLGKQARLEANNVKAAHDFVAMMEEERHEQPGL
jgi:hypothetical protein